MLNLETQNGVLERSTFQSKLFGIKINIVPLGIYLFMLVCMFLAVNRGLMPSGLIGGMTLLALYGYACAELGGRIPLLKYVGGTVIMATFLPSYLVYADLIPKLAVTSIVTFMKTTNFLYVYIACLVVGSICSMNRYVLIKAFLKMFVPLVIGTIVAMAVGTLAGILFGIGWYHTFFFIVIPILAGGVGEGALPLSMGYSSIMGTEQDAIFASVLPCVMLGSLIAIVISGGLNMLGQKHPEYTGNGNLLKTGDDEILKAAAIAEEEKKKIPIDNTKMLNVALFAFSLFIGGTWVDSVIGLPAPIVMLVTAVCLKAAGLVPDYVDQGAHALFRFIVLFTPPLLLGVGVAMTPWKNVVAVFTNPAYLVVILITVSSLIATAWFVSQKLNMNPVEAAMVVACHSGQGGTGDVAILTAGKRLELMPFAQVSTRLGGVANVTMAIALMRILAGN
ncbi:MAG: 2-hydroxycarboxylate transporter family protein [Megasphaera sp.]|jgi:CCS family citrate carrier protein|uniref:2-hydroxycarboxylate transporter family protein n=1 Tax=Megasphaera sueciensis TaxID=349094 RepID=UPI003D008038|nr:2-hydroxycarboxylate transporter family protein [Megasphaera sp.]MCI1822621.1 2-hydroxycarboxylate transporter family protein [Megasphaera sp.]